jgi:hypothetical protein
MVSAVEVDVEVVVGVDEFEGALGQENHGNSGWRMTWRRVKVEIGKSLVLQYEIREAARPTSLLT